MVDARLFTNGIRTLEDNCRAISYRLGQDSSDPVL